MTWEHCSHEEYVTWEHCSHEEYVTWEHCSHEEYVTWEQGKVGGMYVPDGILVSPGWYVEGSHNSYHNISTRHMDIL